MKKQILAVLLIAVMLLCGCAPKAASTDKASEEAAAPAVTDTEAAAPAKQEPAEETSEETAEDPEHDEEWLKNAPIAEVDIDGEDGLLLPDDEEMPSESADNSADAQESDEAAADTAGESTGTGNNTEGTSEASSQPSAGSVESDSSGYGAYLAMSPEEKDAFMQSFPSLEDFTAWLIEAQAAYTAEHPTEEIGPGGVITIG